jgi:hypothetical protein
MAARYFDLIREMRSAYNHRLRLVESVRRRRIKPTAPLFLTARSPFASGGDERLAPRSPLQLCLLPPVFLDYYLNDSGGYIYLVSLGEPES